LKVIVNILARSSVSLFSSFIHLQWIKAFYHRGIGILKLGLLAVNMQDAWIAFARTGDPSCEGLGDWPPYSDKRRTMILEENCHVEDAPYEDERRAWEPIPNMFLG
jgi:hypothetical protein